MKRTLLIIVAILFVSTVVSGVTVNIKIPESAVFSEVLVDKIEIESKTKTLTVYTTISRKWTDGLDDLKLENLSRYYLGFFREKIFFKSLVIMTRNSVGEEYLPLNSFLPQLPPVPKKEGSRVTKKSLVPEKGYGNINGFLSGKTVYLSPGHGWYYNANLDRWATQRGVTNGLIEDDSNAELVSYFLLPYIQNAGALVFSARETDRSEDLIIIDEADGDSYSDNGIYEEGGSWTDTTTGKGYGRTAFPIEVGDNIFENGVYRYATVGTGSWARWTANFSSDGYRHVYVSYKTYTDRAEETVYTVNHSGGSTEVKVNQQHHGSTWLDLGKFYFKKGLSIESGSVELNIDDNSTAGAIIIADAVKFGGGMGILSRSEQVSLKPRWEEAAKVNIQFLGAPQSVYQSSSTDNGSDVTARSRWAAWENEADFDDSVYLSWHSNAYNGNSRGLSTYIYSPNDPGSGYFPGSAAEGSESMGEKVHDRILSAVKALYDPNWDEVGYGMYSAYFGELNPSYNNEMPSCLVELAFHDNADDANMLKDPKFRDISARAAYQGIVDYFAERDEVDPVYLPSPPEKLKVSTDFDGNVVVSWTAAPTDEAFHTGHPAKGFKIFTSRDGYGFDNGIDVGDQNYYIFNNLERTRKAFFRVVAYNDGGVSFPSVTAGVIPEKGGAQILVVDGFERVDRFTSRFAVGENASNRYMMEYINSYNYVVKYAEVLSQAGFTMDYIQKSKLTDPDVDIDTQDYDFVIWFSGEQSSGLGTFSDSEQSFIANFISQGGSVFISGSEIGWDLVEKGSTDDTTFFNEVLNVDYIKDSSDMYTFVGAGDLSGLSGSFDDGTYIYQANYPDVIEPYAEGGDTVLFYDESETMGAGIITSGERKVAFLGFPFETILDMDAKTQIMTEILEKFELEPWEVPDGGFVHPDEDWMGDDDMSDDSDQSDESEVSDDSDNFDQSDQSEMSDDFDLSDQSDESDESEVSDDSDNFDQSDQSEMSDDSDKSDGGCGCLIVSL